jgi:hemoglobin/transferrin/lactoferrin receptor protein
LAACAACAAWAQPVPGPEPVSLPASPPAPETDAAALPTVVVTATRSALPVKSVPGTTTVVGRQALEQAQAGNLREALAQEPGVSVPSDPRRFGGGNINIRGIEENRVLMLIDGVRAADFRSPGTTNYDASNRDVPEVDFLKQVEVVRGPASSLHGSDALGGVVGFVTLDPADLLRGRTQAAGIQLSADSANRGRRATAHLARQLGEGLQGLFMLTHGQAHETDNRGSRDVQGLTRTAPNPQDIRHTAFLAKLAWAPLPAHRFKFTLEGKEQTTETDMARVGNRSPSSPGTLTRITRTLGDDRLQRLRGIVDYAHLAGSEAGLPWDRLDAKLYRQQQDTRNDNWQRRSATSSTCSASTSGTANCEVTQRFDFEQVHTGVSAVAAKALGWGAPQQLTWGLDWLRTHTQERKATSWVNLATGVVSNTFIGETFPKSDYPKGHADQLGLFMQDEIALLGGRLRLTPGLRYDHYRLRPEQDDPLYQPSDGRRPASSSGERLSPKLAAAFDVDDTWQVWAQYVEGFRGPSYEETNRFFYNFNQRYALLGNASLKPETSRGLELGLRAGTPRWGGQLSVFHNRYRDFIESRRLAANDPAALPGYSTSQYQNFARVTIEGAELRGQWQPLAGLQLQAGLAHARGRDEETSLPLNSVEPLTFTASATWKPSAAYGGQLRLRAARGKSDVDDSGISGGTYAGGYFRTPGYGVMDASAWWRLTATTTLTVGIDNLLDKRYWLWSDVRRAGLPSSDPGVDFYSQPGRNVSVSLKVEL